MTDDLIHGGALDSMRQRFPDAPEPWLDLSTGISPISYPVSIPAAEYWRALPDAALYEQTRRAMAVSIKADAGQILLTPGSSAAIAALAGYAGFGSAAIVSPTYSEHEIAFDALGKPVRCVGGICEAVPEAVLSVVNPNNPDARLWPASDLLSLAHDRTRSGQWLIVDEAFADFYPEASVASQVAEGLNLIVLRSFGKAYGLAGLRMGAVVAPTLIRQHVTAHMGPWPVSTPALIAARQAYADEVWLARTRADLMARRDRLKALLQDAGLVLEGEALLFVSVRTDAAHRIWSSLAAAGIYVRRFSQDPQRLRFGLPENPQAFQRLERVLGQR